MPKSVNAIPTSPPDTAKLAQPFRVTRGKHFKLKDFATMDPVGKEFAKAEAKQWLADGINQLTELQARLYADNRWSVLLIFQAMDAAGKDGAIEHVMSGVNPQGCQVHAFKAPSHEELDHDFLWRTTCRLPERGRIGIFNRSYYEEVLIARVHEAIIDGQRLPETLRGKDFWSNRMESIADFERHMARNGTVILKFFLNVSLDEQCRRLLARIDDPAKNWKFDAQDLVERGYWPAYMDAYQEAIRATATKHAPWYVVPADDKWFARAVVMAAIVREMRKLDLSYPTLPEAQKAKLADARRQLTAE
jgi:PPK2 family polyphosphate:nucleotide phosphotransferase